MLDLLKQKLRQARDARDAQVVHIQEIEARQVDFDARVDQLNQNVAALVTRKQAVSEAIAEGTATLDEIDAVRVAIGAAERAASDMGDLLAGVTGTLVRARDKLEGLELAVFDAAVALVKTAIKQRLKSRAFRQMKSLASTVALRHTLAKSVSVLAQEITQTHDVKLSNEPISFRGPIDGHFRREQTEFAAWELAGDDQGLVGILKAYHLTSSFSVINADGVPSLTIDELLALDLGDDADEGPSAA